MYKNAEFQDFRRLLLFSQAINLSTGVDCSHRLEIRHLVRKAFKNTIQTAFKTTNSSVLRLHGPLQCSSAGSNYCGDHAGTVPGSMAPMPRISTGLSRFQLILNANNFVLLTNFGPLNNWGLLALDQ